ncbi:cache domain-containing sensor histidine kinase [Tindallia californiensis]|uniref:Two-component system, sensor histidine kinase YesM n=1 Tax=Tindallia californiensis TaxID=159292 RepID=A0A1H3IPM0_9FIRM|nr:sensor histidine kinase [Tindallia californiensis]SDY29650.1 two-component system, sensor histidine kinase YesM [Tindallia californiensis]
MLRKSLRGKILLFFGVVTTLLFSIGIILIQSQIANTNIPLTKDLNQQIITVKADELGGWVNKRVAELRILTETEALSSMDKMTYKPFMRRMDQLHKKDYESFAIVNLEGHAWVTNDTYIDISERPYFNEIQQSKNDYAISDPILSRSNEEPIIVVIHKIYSAEGKVIGYINGAIYLENFTKIAHDIRIYDGKAWLVDSTSNLFTTRGDLHKDWMNLLNLKSSDHLAVDTLKDNISNNKSGIQEIKTPHGQERMVVYAPIPYTNGWSLGIDYSKALMMEDTDTLIYTVFLLGIAVLIMQLFISLRFSKTITEPIVDLQRKMEIVETGNLDLPNESTREDEIGQLEKRFHQMILKIKDLKALFEKEQKEKREAELQILHAQVQPHFLYNTIDTIRWSVLEEETEQSVELLEALSTYYRIGLSQGAERITLEKEMDHIESYLQLLKARYEEELEYMVCYDETLLQCPVLKLILQPLVENALIHGFRKKSRKPFLIQISVKKADKDLMIVVEDDGDAIDPIKLKEIQRCLKRQSKPGKEVGFGLYSTNKRIKLTFGHSYGVSFERIEEKTRVIMKHPILEG